MAMKNKMDLAIGIAIGSSMQIALFVTPFCVLVGWAMGQPMSLDFTVFVKNCFYFPGKCCFILINHGGEFITH